LTDTLSQWSNAAKQDTSKNNIHTLHAKKGFKKFYKEREPKTKRQANVMCLGDQKNKVLI